MTTAAAALLALVTGCSGVAQATETKLESAHAKCVKTKSYAKKYDLADEGHTLIIETSGEHDFKGFMAYDCITRELDTSKRVTSSIETTTSMMGRQSSSDGVLTYEYTYHPDNGLYVLITDQE
jgi:hypothetical protein